MRDVTHTHKHTEDLPKWREIVASPFSAVCVTHKIECVCVVCVCVTRRILRAIMVILKKHHVTHMNESCHTYGGVMSHI